MWNLELKEILTLTLSAEASNESGLLVTISPVSQPWASSYNVGLLAFYLPSLEINYIFLI